MKGLARRVRMARPGRISGGLIGTALLALPRNASHRVMVPSNGRLPFMVMPGICASRLSVVNKKEKLLRRTTVPCDYFLQCKYSILCVNHKLGTCVGTYYRNMPRTWKITHLTC